MVGNDVVDLRDPETRKGATHWRFDARVFAPAELEMVGRDEAVRWTLWAAKESAFKAARKIDPQVIFSPVRFVVRFEGVTEATVSHDLLRIRVRIERRDGAVHAVAATEPGSLIEGFARVTNGDPSAEARRLAIESIAPHLGVDPRSLTIPLRPKKGTFRFSQNQKKRNVPFFVPRLVVDGRPSSVDLSLSHHGGVVGFAARLAA